MFFSHPTHQAPLRRVGLRVYLQQVHNIVCVSSIKYVLANELLKVPQALNTVFLSPLLLNCLADASCRSFEPTIYTSVWKSTVTSGKRFRLLIKSLKLLLILLFSSHPYTVSILLPYSEETCDPSSRLFSIAKG